MASPLKKSVSSLTHTPTSSHLLWRAIFQHSCHNFFRSLFNGFLPRLLLFCGVVTEVSLFVNCESAVIDTNAEGASVSFTAAGLQIMNFLVSGDSRDYGRPSGISASQGPQYSLQ